eukprot:2691729-Pyramimonas_sp.AAC.1
MLGYSHPVQHICLTSLIFPNIGVHELTEGWGICQALPCVIYCHGNSGNRTEALAVVKALLPLNFTVIAFDWGGCGLSGGDYITLGGSSCSWQLHSLLCGRPGEVAKDQVLLGCFAQAGRRRRTSGP